MDALELELALIAEMASHVYEGHEASIMRLLTSYEERFGNASPLLASFLSSHTGRWYSPKFHTWVISRGGLVSPLALGRRAVPHGFWPEFPAQWMLGEYEPQDINDIIDEDEEKGEPDEAWVIGGM